MDGDSQSSWLEWRYVCQDRGDIQRTHIPEVVSYPAVSNIFIYKTSVDDDLDGAQFIYLGHDFVFRQVEVRIIRPLDYILGQIGQCYMQRIV